MGKHRILLEQSFKIHLELLYLGNPFFFDDRPVKIDWILNRHFDRHFNRHLHSALNINRTIDINWFVDIHWLLHVGRYLHLHCFYNFFDDFIRDFFLHFDVLWHFYLFLHNLLYNPLRTRDILDHLNQNLHRLLHNNLFDDLGHPCVKIYIEFAFAEFLLFLLQSAHGQFQLNPQFVLITL